MSDTHNSLDLRGREGAEERESIFACKIHSVKSAALYSTQQSIFHFERPEKENYMIHQAGYSNKLDS